MFTLKLFWYTSCWMRKQRLWGHCYFYSTHDGRGRRHEEQCLVRPRDEKIWAELSNELMRSQQISLHSSFQNHLWIKCCELKLQMFCGNIMFVFCTVHVWNRALALDGCVLDVDLIGVKMPGTFFLQPPLVKITTHIHTNIHLPAWVVLYCFHNHSKIKAKIRGHSPVPPNSQFWLRLTAYLWTA